MMYFCINTEEMKKGVFILLFSLLLLGSETVSAQCSICTKTASQLGEGPAKGMNSGIVYLMIAPLALIGVVGWRWWKREKELTEAGEV